MPCRANGQLSAQKFAKKKKKEANKEEYLTNTFLWNISETYILLHLFMLFRSHKSSYVTDQTKHTDRVRKGNFIHIKKPTLDHNTLKKICSVSNLSFLSKIIEKIVLFQMSDHLCSNSLLNPFQSAHKLGHSTETALSDFQRSLAFS